MLVSCGAATTQPDEHDDESASSATEEPASGPWLHEECAAIMRRTRGCAETYVPALMALRVRLDRPEGIAARFAEEGEDVMLALAHEQFANDWSDDAITANCDALVARPPVEQAAIMGPERVCADTPDCASFVECDMANKERRWTE